MEGWSRAAGQRPTFTDWESQEPTKEGEMKSILRQMKAKSRAPGRRRYLGSHDYPLGICWKDSFWLVGWSCFLFFGFGMTLISRGKLTLKAEIAA